MERSGLLQKEIHLPALPKFPEAPEWLKQYWTVILFWLILAIGVGFRVAGFPNYPPGLNQDEVSAGYESWSLLQYGTDRWGNPWPAYFPSWGSGQNVLYSYLTIPFIKVFGLTAFSVRIVSLLAGIF